eukprot:c11397_g1_i1 orf=236-664(+)
MVCLMSVGLWLWKMHSRASTTTKWVWFFLTGGVVPCRPPSHSRMFGSGLMYQDELHEINNASKQLLEQRFQSRSSSQACRSLKPTSIHGSAQDHISMNEYSHPTNGCLLQLPSFVASGAPPRTLYNSDLFILHALTRSLRQI